MVLLIVLGTIVYAIIGGLIGYLFDWLTGDVCAPGIAAFFWPITLPVLILLALMQVVYVFCEEKLFNKSNKND